MRLPHFEYLSPRTLDEACSLLAAHEGRAAPLAGGTDLLVKMKQRRAVPRYLVNLKAISGLDAIRYDEPDGLRVGALATIQSLKNSPVVKRHVNLLAQAAGVESSVQIRNLATLGGNIANASPAADAPLALLVLGASVVLARAGREREVTLEEFFVGPGKTCLEPGELIREVHVPPLPPGSGGAYLKHSVRRTDIAIVSAAALLRVSEGVCEAARIGLGSVAPTALRARDAEEALVGRKLTDEVAGRAADAAAAEARPIDDIRGYAEYRASTVREITKEVILRALQDARLGRI
ncbi:MAG: xanthine dehydrogenase family protein subunit M [Deltaproteobacteria bacterium]|nr:xanthine dehydrogenase family protein subunit M [Deltaproteobacteria bacterium]